MWLLLYFLSVLSQIYLTLSPYCFLSSFPPLLLPSLPPFFPPSSIPIIHIPPSLPLPISSDDITEVYPLSRIEQEVKEQKDMYGSLDLHETYYKVRQTHSPPSGVVGWPMASSSHRLSVSLSVLRRNHFLNTSFIFYGIYIHVIVPVCRSTFVIL